MPTCKTGLHPFRKGLSEVYRVLVPGGRAIINVPIHLHGHPLFVVGDLPRIKGLFNPLNWETVQFEEWRRKFTPLEGWHLARPPISDEKIPNSNDASTWILDIVATKVFNEQKGFNLELSTRWIDTCIKVNHCLKTVRNKMSRNALVRNAIRTFIKRQ